MNSYQLHSLCSNYLNQICFLKKSIIKNNTILNSYNYSNYYYTKIDLQKNSINEQQSDETNEHINLFLFDNDIIKYGGDNFSELLLFQNCLKIFSIYHLSKNFC